MPSSHRRNRSTKQHPSDLDAGEEPHTLSLFRTRLAAGDYDAVIGKGLRRTLQGAAADATLEAEVGALRVALAKLLREEDDPTRLAAGVSRVAGVAIQAARLRNASADVESFRNTFLRELDAFEKERARHKEQDTREEMHGNDDDGRYGDLPAGADDRAGTEIR